jgi:hypothetical protein
LQKRYGCENNLNMIRHAQSVLIEEGLIEPRQGLGTYVIALPGPADNSTVLAEATEELRAALDAAQAALTRISRALPAASRPAFGVAPRRVAPFPAGCLRWCTCPATGAARRTGRRSVRFWPVTGTTRTAGRVRGRCHHLGEGRRRRPPGQGQTEPAPRLSPMVLGRLRLVLDVLRRSFRPRPAWRWSS